MRSVFSLIYSILRLVSAWKVFRKYREPGWKALIPVYSDYVEFGKVWSPAVGVVYGVLFLLSCILKDPVSLSGKLCALLIAGVLAVVSFIFAFKKAKAFDRTFLMALLLLIAPFLGNLILGFGRAEYRGRNRRNRRF